MGVPAFFRWLSSRNPKIIINAQNNDDDFTDPDNNTEENVNPYIDNFYLDMNGIIHPCCHPQNNQFPTPQSFDEMVNNIYTYVDYLMNVVRPQKLLYLAIDGVAPRAKMNQQRCRRFRACQEREESKKKKQELRDHWKQSGQFDKTIDEYINEQGFDSNVITPGTEFMHDLSVSIQAYIYERMNTHPLWKNLNIVFSDANIPGEGEHKILEFIRLQRAQPGYNPNTSHCLYGADADLLMLGLSTHEPYFYIIREEVISNENKTCTLCGQKGHFFTECEGATPGENKDFGNDQQKQGSKKIREIPVTFQYAKLQIMREYFELEFKELELNFEFNLENIIDDFNFMCFFVGNDFIPHIPSLSIRDGGIDALMILYKSFLPEFGGYLTEGQKVNLKRVSQLLSKVAEVEQAFIEDKQRREERGRQRNQINQLNGNKNNNKNGDDEYAIEEEEEETLVQKFKKKVKEDNKEAGIVPDEVSQTSSEFKHLNYREIWYREKFDVAPEDFKEFKQSVKQSYAEALCWNYAYYYRGCISWNWYYPYHYAPFASDLDDLHKLKIDFDYGAPFKPFQQLLSVFPPGSKNAIPSCYHTLMTDPESPIIDFYPLDFFVDLKGKRFAWLGEIILPFIDEDRLLTASSEFDNQLTKQEQFRNRLGKAKFFIHKDRFQQNFKDKDEKKILTWPELGIAGELSPNTTRFQVGGKINMPFNGLKLEPIENNQVEEIFYENPQYVLHMCKLLEGVTPPEREINDEAYLGKVDKRMYMGQNVIRLIQRNLKLPQQQFKTGMGRLNQYNQQSNLNKYNNQFVSRQQELGNVNFQMGPSQIQQNQRQQYQRIGQEQDQQQNQQNYRNNNYNNNYNQNNSYNQNRYQQNQGYQNQNQNQNQNYRQNNNYNQNRRNNYQNNNNYNNNNQNNNNRNQKQTYSQKMNLNNFQQNQQQQYQQPQFQQQKELSSQQQHYQNNQPYFVKNSAAYQPNQTYGQGQQQYQYQYQKKGGQNKESETYDPAAEFDQMRKIPKQK